MSDSGIEQTDLDNNIYVNGHDAVSELTTNGSTETSDDELESKVYAQDYANEQTQAGPSTILIGKPDKHAFVRFHDDPNYTKVVYLYETKDGEWLVVDRPVAEELHRRGHEGAVRLARLYVGIDEDGDLFLLPVMLPDADGSLNNWHRGRMSMILLGRKRWIQMIPKKKFNTYRAYYPKPGDEPADPVFPNVPIDNILREAFEGRRIKSLDDPTISSLLSTPGELGPVERRRRS